MLRRIAVSALFVLVCFAFASAAQRQMLKIVPDPAGASGVKAAGSLVQVEWVQLVAGGGAQSTPEAEPVEGEIYYATAPAAGDLSKYRHLSDAVESNRLASFGSSGAQKRYTRFIPDRQGGRMGPGVYCAIVASVVGGDTLYSDYFNIMVASAEPPAIVYPRAEIMKGELAKTISELAPLFQWKAVAGVPYYHIVLADAPFTNADGRPNANVNIIWQAITPNTRIAYGAPDPSNTVTASPPPLTSGRTYSWMVLNNYGNHTAFTSWDVISVLDQVAGRFEIEATALSAPRATAPATGATFRDDAQIEFKWANPDPNANSYLLNLFRAGSTADFGMADIGNFSMNLLAWEATVPRGAGDTMSVILDAAGTLTGGSYMWRVYALDSRGAASTSTEAAPTFTYRKSGEGSISIKTVETVGGEKLPLGFVELKSEVIEGPTMTPLLFYTNGSGVFDRSNFSAGTYRITAVREGYYTSTATVTVTAGGRAEITLPMSRPEAVLYGKALLSSDNSAVNMATVTAASEWGDTLAATTDGNGRFMLACKAGDWVVSVSKHGLGSTSPRRVSLRVGDNRDMGEIRMERNPFALSGVVRNSNGGPVIAARVRVLREGVLVDELSSTPQNGVYAFYLNPGTYTLTAEKLGFVMFSRSVTVTGATLQDITLRGGAALVNGTVVGRSWVSSRYAGAGGYADAPIPSARVTFIEVDAASPDTFMAISDPVFGKFSVSLPEGKSYSVTALSAGFAEGVARSLTLEGGGSVAAYTDTLYALASIKGLVTGSPLGVPIDVLVYDGGNRVVASARSSTIDGGYEVRNVPNGVVTVVAGAEGYNTSDNYRITVNRGTLTPNLPSYNFRMEPGDKSVRFDISGYSGSGAVKVVLPFNKTIPFDSASGVRAELNSAGAGDYVVEAAPDSSNSGRLELSYHKFSVLKDLPEHTETIYFPYRYSAPVEITVNSSGQYVIDGPTPIGITPSNAVRMTLYYRSEGSVRFDSMERNVVVGSQPSFSFTPVRDGCNLYYYFRIEMENGDVYGSSRQFYRTFVRPDAAVVSRVAVEPGAFGGDTLFMPSSYPAVFTFRAFYSDQFAPLDDNAGIVSWDIVNAGTGERLNRANAVGASYSYTTPSGELDITLRATFTPSGAYTMRAGVSNVFEFPIRVTGESLKSLNIVRKGDGGPASNTEQIGFKVEALDGLGKAVTVSPRWSVTPRGAGEITVDGLFTPSGAFFGMVGIGVSAGGLMSEYTELGAEMPGQKVYYAVRHRATGGDTANTMRGMRLAFGPGAVREGATALFDVAVPELQNHVYKGTDELKMADSAAFDLTCANIDAVTGSVALIFDIPAHLRDAAKRGEQEFKVARWLPDSLKWIPVDSARMRFAEGYTAVSAVLSNPAAVTAAQSKKSSKQEQDPRASELSVSARYALVTKMNGTLLHVSVSPHPFSPYIVPIREHGSKAKRGTCIKVNVEAPQTAVRSIQVHVYNAVGKRVWAVKKHSAPTGVNNFWWDGRTTGSGSGRSAVSEETWSEAFEDRTTDRPMCRNGRYFVTVIMTTQDGKQRRAMKPVVLMK